MDGSQIGSIWIPVDAMSEAAGVSWVLGSHKWGLFRPRHFADASPYAGTEHLPAMPDVERLRATGGAAVKAFAVEPGDVLAFDARIVHGSKGNADAAAVRQRRVALRFGGDDAVYCERPGETAIPTPDVAAEHGLAHGQPLACDTFPRVWPRAADPAP